MTVIDLNAERSRRDGPDAEFRTSDAHGVEMFLFSIDYQFCGSEWSFNIWAYSFEDAEARVDAMRNTLNVAGQIHSIIPA